MLDIEAVLADVDGLEDFVVASHHRGETVVYNGNALSSRACLTIFENRQRGTYHWSILVLCGADSVFNVGELPAEKLRTVVRDFIRDQNPLQWGDVGLDDEFELDDEGTPQTFTIRSLVTDSVNAGRLDECGGISGELNEVVQMLTGHPVIVWKGSRPVEGYVSFVVGDDGIFSSIEGESR